MKNDENSNNVQALLTYLCIMSNVNVDISNKLWSKIRNNLINNKLSDSETVIIKFLNDIDRHIRNLIQKIYNVETYKTDIRDDPPEYITDRLAKYQIVLSEQIKCDFS